MAAKSAVGRSMPEPEGGASAETLRSLPGHRSLGDPLKKRALRTKQHLIDTAKDLFLERGYAATTIDNIADAAGVSRASFYTYFSSKREIMIVAGHDCRHTSWKLFEELGEVNIESIHEGVESWIAKYFKFLEKNGGYLLMWQQAAMQDSELRKLGMRGSQKATKILGASFQKLGVNRPEQDIMLRCLAVMAMLDRFWYLWFVTKAPFTRAQVLDNLSSMIIAAIRA